MAVNQISLWFLSLKSTVWLADVFRGSVFKGEVCRVYIELSQGEFINVSYLLKLQQGPNKGYAFSYPAKIVFESKGKAEEYMAEHRKFLGVKEEAPLGVKIGEED